MRDSNISSEIRKQMAGDKDIGNTLQLKLNCKNCCPYVKLLKQSLHYGKVVMCMIVDCFFCSFSCCVRAPLASNNFHQDIL